MAKWTITDGSVCAEKPEPITPIVDMTDHRAQQMMRVNDPEAYGLIGAGPTPALTVLLIDICGRDMQKFDKACRLISLFMDEAEC